MTCKCCWNPPEPLSTFAASACLSTCPDRPHLLLLKQKTYTRTHTHTKRRNLKTTLKPCYANICYKYIIQQLSHIRLKNNQFSINYLHQKVVLHSNIFSPLSVSSASTSPGCSCFCLPQTGPTFSKGEKSNGPPRCQGRNKKPRLIPDTVIYCRCCGNSFNIPLKELV